MTDEVRFVEETHQYFINGVEYPSVSTVLSLFADYARVPRAVLERKRMIGRAVHHAIQLYEEDALDPDSIADEWAGFFEGWIKLKADMPGQVVASEQIVFSKKHRCAGRLDINYVLKRDECLWQWDVKCVDAMSSATALQTSAYTEFWNEMHSDQRIKKRAGVQLCPDGSYIFHPYTKPENRRDFAVFCNALAIRNWQLNHRR